MDVVGYADGTLLYVGVPEGSAAQVNEIIAIVGKEGEDIKSLIEAPAGAPATSAAAPVSAAAATPAPSWHQQQQPHRRYCCPNHHPRTAWRYRDSHAIAQRYHDRRKDREVEQAGGR